MKIVSLDNLKTFYSKMSTTFSRVGHKHNKGDINGSPFAYVCYEDFGAIGNGSKNDYLAIKNAHEYANLNNLPVKADGSKTYYISDKLDDGQTEPIVMQPIPIKTCTDWSNCKIKIEEKIQPTVTDIFQVVSDYDPITISTLTDITINKNTKNIPKLAGYGYCLVDVINENKKQFIRKGSNTDTGFSQTDQFLVDNNGNVLNDIIWDFDNITSITLYPIDKSILTIGNVNFITVENNIVGGDYLRKGLFVTRSNTIVHNISHDVIENTTQNSPSRGIVYFNTCANVVIRDSELHARLVYNDYGTYELNYYKVVNAIIDNVRDKYFLDTKRWGCHTSNYTKDMKIYNSKLSRIDAHKGIWNLTIRDTEVGHQGLRLTGGGSLIIENFTSYSGTLIAFRGDYGSTWNGKVRAKNIIHKPINIGTNLVSVVNFNNDMTHDFGYQCYHTLGIQMENYYLYNYNENANNGIFNLISISTSDFSNAIDSCRVIFPYELTFKNFKCNNGGFKLIDGYLDAFRVGVPFIYTFGEEVYSTTTKSLSISTNVSITLDDIKLASIGDNNIIALKGTGRQADDTYTSVNTRILPNIKIINCDNIYCDLMGYPFIFECYNSTLESSNFVSNGSRHIATFNNCIFAPLPLTTASITFRFNGITTSFVGCYFKKPIYANGAVVDKNTIANCYSFLGYNGVNTSNTDFRSLCSFVGCRIDTSVSPFTLFTALSSFNYEFNSSYGTKYKK